MKKLNNEEKVGKITMMPTAVTLCDIGNDWYTNQLEITFVPDKYYPDYIEVKDWIMINIDGKRLNIEQVVERVYKFLIEQYEPIDIHVKDTVTGSKSHFDVIVEK